MDLKHLLLAVVVFLAVAINQGGDALKCHQCSSHEHTKCRDPFVDEPTAEGEEPRLKTDEFLKDCPTDREYTLCRKIYQNVRGKDSVIRSCGWLEYKNPCYKTVLEEYNTYVCTCKGDGCNGSAGLSISLLTVAITTLAAFLAK